MERKRGDWMRLVAEQESDEVERRMEQLQGARRAAAMLQGGLRKQRWLRLLRRLSGKSIKLHHIGYYGVSLFPIRRMDGALIGYEGRSGRRYSQPQHGWCVLQTMIPNGVMEKAMKRTFTRK